MRNGLSPIRITPGGRELSLIDWAVMQDPFGNEFCRVHELKPEQSLAAVAVDASTDHEWRVAARQTNP